ncbi:chronophin [Eurosta solidaginis]|uniref:chronophin n=1 Tax=Eurosta solidaginis TaxID=178769 RepID=UPI003530CC97
MTSNGHNIRKSPKHILELSTDEKRAFLDSFDHIFSDIDGVLWNVIAHIPGAADGYRTLTDLDKKLNFITNNSVRPMSDYEKKFKEAGIEFDVNDLVHPAKSIVEYLRNIEFEGLIYVIATEAVKDVIREAGFQITDGPTIFIEESYRALASHIFSKDPIRAVVVDVDFNLTSMKILRAHQFLRHPDCILIEAASDKLLPVGNGIDIIGPGPFTKILAECSKKPLITLGKPGKSLAEIIIKKFNIKETKRSLMIGDTLESDIAFGRQCGFQTLAVLSGFCKLQDIETESNPSKIPDYYADSMADFVEFMNDLNKSKE